MEKQWYSLTEKQLFEDLKTSEQGLTTKECQKRQEKYGKNVLPKKKKESVIKIFFKELLNPIELLLLVAVIASFMAGEPIEGIAIILIVLVDVLMGTYQENKANNTAEALSKLVTVKNKVLRDGEEKVIDASELVPGDFVFLESGDKISADLRIIEAHNFTVDESILTGESLAVTKNSNSMSNKKVAISEQLNMLFSGTSVVTGRAKAIVVATALDTELGQIANTINNTKETKSPLTIRVEELSKQISMLIIIVALIVTILLVSKGGMTVNEIFLSVVALAVSAMPEGLPLALTMALCLFGCKNEENPETKPPTFEEEIENNTPVETKPVDNGELPEDKENLNLQESEYIRGIITKALLTLDLETLKEYVVEENYKVLEEIANDTTKKDIFLKTIGTSTHMTESNFLMVRSSAYVYTKWYSDMKAAGTLPAKLDDLSATDIDTIYNIEQTIMGKLKIQLTH